MKTNIRKTRRPNGDGCIYYTKDGYWCAKKWTNENDAKKRVSVYAKTRIELMRKFIMRFGNDKVIQGCEKLSFSFNDSFLDWLLNVKKLEVSSTTLNCNITLFRNHIKSYFEKKSIEQSINNETILDLFNKLIEIKISKNIFLKTRFLINQYINYLLLMKYPIEYPIILKKIKYTNRNIDIKYKAIPNEIYDNYIQDLNENKTLKCVCFLGLFAGLRIGEILVLKWDNVDFTNRTIRIDSSLSKNVAFDSNGNVKSCKKIIGQTKTSCSKRTVPIPDVLYKMLYEYKLENKVLELIENKQFLFIFNNDNQLRSYSGLRIMLSRFNNRHGYKSYNIHFHSFRHTYATRLLEKRTNPKIVQFLLGHRSVKTTLDIYNNINICNNSLLKILNNVF